MLFRQSFIPFLLLFSSVAIHAQSTSSTVDQLKAEFLSCPQKSGSSYYAYPGPQQAAYTPAPDGFKPVYISHYGRHGSRWVTSDARYRFVIDIMDSNTLTPAGKQLRDSLELVWNDVKGRGGDLTAIGEQQHHDIALRMFRNYSSIFSDSSHVRAFASTSRRCMMSMMSFCESLKEQNPSLKITRSAHERDMSFINYESPALHAFTNDSSAWSKEFSLFYSSNVSPSRLLSSLFLHPDSVPQQMHFMEELYWIVQNQQDTPLGLNLYSVFTPDELFAIWKATNVRMYVTNSGSPLNDGIPAACARNLLNHIILSADEALSDGNISATLRFGHDSALLKLLTLMDVNGVNAHIANYDDVCLSWQDFRISPMAANLQVIFYKDASQHVLVKLLLNENEVTLPLPSEYAPYYDWQNVRAYWEMVCNK